jgi:CRP-like cAMP-binding protein
MYIITEGKVEVIKGGQAITRIGSPEIIGEMALFLDEKRSASVIAVALTKVIQMTLGHFEEWLSGHPAARVALRIIKTLANRVRETTEKLVKCQMEIEALNRQLENVTRQRDQARKELAEDKKTITALRLAQMG